jgi:hypothetical protein
VGDRRLGGGGGASQGLTAAHAGAGGCVARHWERGADGGRRQRRAARMGQSRHGARPRGEAHGRIPCGGEEEIRWA